jgi:hypothetical protein
MNKAVPITLFFLTMSLFPAEVILKSGKAFICDILTEEERQIKISYKEQVYIVPRSEIQTIDYKKKGVHISRFYPSFQMKDGSSIKGLIAEADKTSYTLQTDNGFIVIEKNKIASQEKDFEKNPEFPKDLLESANSPETRIGVGGSGFVNGAPLSGSHPSSLGGFLFIEPAFLGFAKKFQLGYRTDYFDSAGNGKYSFYNNFGYLQYNLKISRFLHFYVNAGGGASSVRYQSRSENFSGINPAGYMELGYQGLQWDRVFIRLALRGVYINEKGLGFGMGGGEISFGVKI